MRLFCNCFEDFMAQYLAIKEAAHYNRTY